MRPSLRAGLGALAVMLAACQAAPAAADPPAAVAAAICRPTFQVDGQPLAAGTAFLLADGATIRLVTAQHLFGADGGLPAEIAWSDLPARVASVHCVSLSGGRDVDAGPPLAIPGARPLSAGLPYRDVAAFPLTGAPAGALRLAAQPPARGEPVWLVAQVLRAAAAEQRLHRGRVVAQAQGVLQFVHDNGELAIQATSGAPVVNAAGEVVGVNLGGGRDEQTGELIGVALNLTALRAALGSARAP